MSSIVKPWPWLISGYGRRPAGEGVRRFLLTLVANVLAFLASAGIAQATGPMAALERLGCLKSDSTDLRSYHNENETLLMLMSAWSGESITALAEAAGLDGGGVPTRNAQHIANVHPQLIARMTADMTALGPAICPAVQQSLTDSIWRVVSDQGHYRSYYHPMINAVQHLINLHGCGALEIDGALGPQTRQGLATLRAAMFGTVQPPDSLQPPNPAELTRMARPGFAAGVCSTHDAGDLPVLSAHALIGMAFGREGWLRQEDAVIDLARQAGSALAADHEAGHEVSPLQRGVLEWIAHEMGNDQPEQFLVSLFSQGIRVPPLVGAADYWRQRIVGGDAAWARYNAAITALDRGDPDAAELVARAVARLLDALAIDPYGHPRELPFIYEPGAFDDPDSGAARPFGLAAGSYPIRPAGPPMYIDDITPLAWLAHLLTVSPAAEAILTEQAEPYLLSWLATQLLEARAGAEADSIAIAARLLREAADRGDSFAMARLAFMHLHGMGVTRDIAFAAALAERADATGEPFAAFLLAQVRDAAAAGDPAQAGQVVDAYMRAAARGGEVWEPTLIGVANRLNDPDSVLSSPEGARALRDAVWQQRAARLALAIAEAAICVDCGSAVDPAEAATWLRLADDIITRPDDDEAVQQGNGDGGMIVLGNRRDDLWGVDGSQPARLLARLLALYPDLAQEREEAATRLRRHAGDEIAQWRHAPRHHEMAARLMLEPGEGAEAGTVTALLDQLCALDELTCLRASRFLASGEAGTIAIGPAVERLLAMDAPQLIDILAAFGDFDGALARARQEAALSPDGLLPRGTIEELGDLRQTTIRRLLAGRDAAEMATLPTSLEPLLVLLSASGDLAAMRFLALLRQPAPDAPPLRGWAGIELARYDDQLARGELSRAFTLGARGAARAAADEGDTARALELELVALRGDLALAPLSGLAEGPLWITLTEVCHLSRTSERVFALGAEELALVLAKDAVNRLQGLRRDLSTMPETLQTCFRDLVADHYRWLADLFVRQDRLDEAEHVLGLLKDFETFQFVERDTPMAGRGFDPIPLSPQEEALMAGVEALRLPLGPDARRAAELRDRRARTGLSEDEAALLARLDDRLAEVHATFEASLRDLAQAATELDRAEVVTQLRSLGPIQGRLRHGADARAAALHYVVLDDRMSIMLTTPDLRLGHTITEWEGAPFSEARLDAAIEDLHATLMSPSLDPRPVAQRLHALLIEPLAHELDAAEVDLVLLSLDRRLRYLPFAALHDGNGFLVERFDLSTLSETPFELGGQREAADLIAALGMSTAAPGFAPLPGAALEVSGLVRTEDGAGMMPGRLWLDRAFDATALEDALRLGMTGAGLGLVHIASHFHLGPSETESFLLLGSGERLDLATMRNNPFAYDFGSVGLLTLSACATGFSNPDRDGRELESLASITGRAGARAVMASLWPVQDNTTAILMQRFYELMLQGGHSRATALALVQREFIARDIGSRDNLDADSVALENARRGGVQLTRSHPTHDLGIGHPFYWAPFVLTGNWR